MRRGQQVAPGKGLDVAIPSPSRPGLRREGPSFGRLSQPFLRGSGPPPGAPDVARGGGQPLAGGPLAYCREACIVLRRGRILDVWLKVRERSCFRKAHFAQKFEMASDLEPARLIDPGRSLGLDEVAIDEHASLGKGLVAACINCLDGLLAAEIMQGPGRDDGVGLSR